MNYPNGFYKGAEIAAIVQNERAEALAEKAREVRAAVCPCCGAALQVTELEVVMEEK